MLNLTDENAFDKQFTKMINLMQKVDFMLSPQFLVKLTDPNFLKKEKQKSIYKIRCLAFVYSFYAFGEEYVKEFLDNFLFRMPDTEVMENVLSMIEELKNVTIADKNDFKGILTSIENLLGFNGHQFFLNICYYCSILDTQEDITKFIDFYSVNAKHIYYSYQFDLLELDQISSDEEVVN